MLDHSQWPIVLGRRLLPECLWHSDSSRPVVALSYDDGPDRERTPRLLDALSRAGVVATFFCVGDRLEADWNVAESAHAQGHAIGLHGQRHHSFLIQSRVKLVHEIVWQRNWIADRLGKAPRSLCFVRPPFGHITSGQVRALSVAGFRVVMASILPRDWSASPDLVIKRVLAQVRNGSLIALHDAGRAGRNAVEIASRLTPLLQERGYSFATVPGLFSNEFTANEPAAK